MTEQVTIELSFCAKGPASLGFYHPDQPTPQQVIDGANERICWIPRSRISNIDDIDEDSLDVTDQVDLVIPRWLAENEELESYCEEVEKDTRW